MIECEELEFWWGLGKAQYLTIPRSIIQEMPKEWQKKFAELLFELDDAMNWRPDGRYFVKLMNDDGTEELGKDPLAEYRHGNPKAEGCKR